MPKSRGRKSRRTTQARVKRSHETQGAQRRAEVRRAVSPGRYRFRRVAGWSLVVLGVAIGVTHWLTHIQVWDFASQGIEDLLAGYPMAAVLGVGGAVVLTKA